MHRGDTAAMCISDSLHAKASTTTSERPQGNSKTKSNHKTHEDVSSEHWSEHPVGHITAGTVMAVVFIAFSLYFPFFLAPLAASETYHFAFYDYDPDKSHFDNSFWTFGTDYMLAFVMGIIIFNISTVHTVSRSLACQSRGLLLCYLLSVAAGGLAHQFYTTIESRNTPSFRFLWTLCVGTVTAATTFMGRVGSELVRHDSCKQAWLPIIPDTLWVASGIASTAVVVFGGLSHQRPACDIFIAGITQLPSSIYMMVILVVGLPVQRVQKWARVAGFAGFVMNAPLLPIYPLLVQYTDWSLASVNAMLHTWLCIAWGMQGLCMRHIGQVLEESSTGPPFTAVPVKTKDQ